VELVVGGGEKKKSLLGRSDAARNPGEKKGTCPALRARELEGGTAARKKNGARGQPLAEALEKRRRFSRDKKFCSKPVTGKRSTWKKKKQNGKAMSTGPKKENRTLKEGMPRFRGGVGGARPVALTT